MPSRKPDQNPEREQAVIDRAERIAAFRLTRILTTDSALPLGVSQRSDGDGLRVCGGPLVAAVYIEPRPKGRPEGTPIEDYVVEDDADHILHVAETQQQAIDWAKRDGRRPHVARVRHLNNKRVSDHWREA